MSTAAAELTKRLHAIYDLDLTRLDDMVRLGRQSQRVTQMLALAVAAAERDARRKLGRVRLGQGSAMKAWATAWVVTRPLRMAVAALRQASAQAVAYRVELDKQFTVPLAQAAREARAAKRVPDRRRDGFDILGGA